MDLRVKAWQLPPRLITGAYFINAGLSKRGADDATAGQLHGFAAGTYPVVGKGPECRGRREVGMRSTGGDGLLTVRACETNLTPTG